MGSMIERTNIMGFLSAAKSAGICLAYYGEEGNLMALQPVKRSNEDLVSEHLGIDIKKLEEEKMACLKIVNGEE